MEFGDGPKSISKNNIKSVNEAMGEKNILCSIKQIIQILYYPLVMPNIAIENGP